MVLLARTLARLIGILLALLIAALGLAAAIFCIQGGHGTVSLPALASDLHLRVARVNVGEYLTRLQDSGPVAWVSIGGGAGAIALGLLLLAGSLIPRRERLLVLDEGPQGRLAARRRPIAHAATALAEQPDGIIRVRTRARPWRRGHGGRLRVQVRAELVSDGRPEHAKKKGRDEVKDAARERVIHALGPLTEPLALRPRVLTKITHEKQRRVR